MRSAISILGIFALTWWLGFLVHAQMPSTHQAWGEVHPPNALQEDFKTLKRLLYKYHIDLDYYATPTILEQVFDSMEQKLQVDMSTMVFFNHLVRLNRHIANVHTSIVPPRDVWQGFKDTAGIFPVVVYSHLDSLFVLADRSYEHNLTQGALIRTINGLPASELLKSFRAGLKRDGNNLTYPVHRADYSFGLLYARTFGLCEQFVLELTNPDGGTVKATVSARTAFGREVLQAKSYPRLYLPSADTITSVLSSIRYINEIAILKVGSFQISSFKSAGGSYKRFFKDVFKSLRKRGCKKLIVDVRDNAGGQPEPVEELLRYLLDKPFSIYHDLVSLVDRIDPEDVFDEESQANQYNEMDWRPQGDTYVLHRKPKELEFSPYKNRFQGEMIVLINGFTGSAAGTFAGQLKGRKDVEFVGVETGGNPSRTVAWHILKKTLEHTGIQLNIPLVRSVKAIQVKLTDRGLRPDLELRPTVQDLIEHKDPVLSIAIKRLAE